MPETTYCTPEEAGFDGAKGFVIPAKGMRLKVQLQRGSIPPSKFPNGDFKEQLLWFMPEGKPSQLIWCNPDDEWFELHFTRIEKP